MSKTQTATMQNPVMYRGYRIEVRNTSARFLPAQYATYVTHHGAVVNVEASGAESREDAVTLAKMEIDALAQD